MCLYCHSEVSVNLVLTIALPSLACRLLTPLQFNVPSGYTFWDVKALAITIVFPIWYCAFRYKPHNFKACCAIAHLPSIHFRKKILRLYNLNFLHYQWRQWTAFSIDWFLTPPGPCDEFSVWIIIQCSSLRWSHENRRCSMLSSGCDVGLLWRQGTDWDWFSCVRGRLVRKFSKPFFLDFK